MAGRCSVGTDGPGTYRSVGRILLQSGYPREPKADTAASEKDELSEGRIMRYGVKSSNYKALIPRKSCLKTDENDIRK